VIDYVIKIADIPPFRTALRAEAETGSPYAMIDDNDEAKIKLSVTGIIAQVGNSTASICRLDQDQYDWLIGLPQVVVLGSADVIKEISDITWVAQGKGFYHAIHKQDPYDIDDGDGGTITITPPFLHCILAS